MILEEQDKALLGGDCGPAAARAMAILQKFGEAVGAERFVSIASAHIDACLYHGQSSLDFAGSLAALGGRVQVLSTLNVAALDMREPASRADTLYNGQAALIAHYEAMGCMPTLTCAPYQRMFRPTLGEHVVWAESNAIVFANSALGARTARYGDFADICAALTGRTPLHGLHLDSEREPDLVINVPSPEASALSRDLYFASLGYLTGALAGERVPLICGVGDYANEDELKALGASAATTGSVGLFHVPGITPEARERGDDLVRAARDLPRHDITGEQLRAAVARLAPFATGDTIGAVCVGTPHFSATEFARLRALIVESGGRAAVPFFSSTSREIADQIADDPDYDVLRDFGVQIVVDTCTYLTPDLIQVDRPILTNSAKWVHYAPGNIGKRAGLASLQSCVASAVAGRLVAA